MVDGARLVSGCNVENASYGLSLCAERAALAAACALTGWHLDKQTSTRLEAPADASEGARMPCGACRQWLVELAPEAVVIVDGVDGAWRATELLPMAFTLRRDGGANAHERTGE